MEIDSVIETIFSGPDVVFTAQLRQQDGKQYFCKQLPIAYQQDDKMLKQFDQEITFMESLKNDQAVLKGYQGKGIGGNPAIVYDYEEYYSVGRIVSDCVTTDHRIPLSLGINWSLSVIEGIEQLISAAKEFGKSDIDIAIWPDTLFIDESGHLRITHFSLNRAPSISSSIIKNDLKRYFIYAAPEQVIAGHVPDERVLYFGLGMLIFELLTSKPLFTNHSSIDSKQVVRRKLRMLHPLLSDVDSSLEPLNSMINQLMRPHPDNRLTQLSSIKDQLLELSNLLQITPELSSAETYNNFKDILSVNLKSVSHSSQGFDTTNINEFNAS
ncbi:MAG: hypothetical protein KAJ95_10990 [Gammaproteobacteria bacterium]|nr:hypothetical protein [Gammaproteobacteria bacterium]